MTNQDPSWLNLIKKTTAIIWGLVSMVISLAFIGWIIFLGWSYFENEDRRESKQVVVNTAPEPGLDAQPASLTFGEIIHLTGSPYNIVAMKDPRDENSGYYSNSGRVYRNLLWIDQETGSNRWLFPGMEQRIDNIEVLHASGSHDKPRAVRMTLILGDTNNDGQLTKEDTHAMALVRPDGTGYRVVLAQVQRILHVQTQEDHLALIYQHAGKLHIARVALADFATVLDTVAPDMGPGQALIR